MPQPIANPRSKVAGFDPFPTGWFYPTADTVAPQRPNERWSVDFVHDRLVNRRTLRLLTVHDHYSRECLWIEVDTSLSGKRPHT